MLLLLVSIERASVVSKVSIVSFVVVLKSFYRLKRVLDFRIVMRLAS